VCVAAALGYPAATDALVPRLGVRGFALLLIAVSLATLWLARTPWRSELHPVARAALPGLAALAAVSGERLFLLLIPAWIYAALFLVFRDSLRAEDSIVERMARWIEPWAPDFIRSYCRVVTALLATLFLLDAAVIAMLAAAGASEAWRLYTGSLAYAILGLVLGAEFLIRKTWFRYYYYGGPFDRFWSGLFPAERTARGRRSMAYIAQVKRELGVG